MILITHVGDTSDPGHFGPKTFRHHQTGAEVSGHFDTSALVPNCLNLKHTYLVYLKFYVYNIAHLLLSSGAWV